MAKFDWGQYPSEADAVDQVHAPAREPAGQKAAGKFDWNDFAAEPAAPKGKEVYDKPVGPERVGIEGVIDRVKDPDRWKAILMGSGPYAPKVVQGDAPLALPGGAIPKLTKAAVALAEGQGLGYAAGRTALSAGQGAIMSAMDGKEGDTLEDKYNRVKSGAKLSGGIQLAAESLPYVGKAAGYVGRKLGSALSGVDESILQNYAKRTDEVNDLIKQSGGDITEAADRVRSELSSGIQSAKSKLNSQISSTLGKASPEANISVQPLIEKLEAAKAKLNPNFKAGAISEIDDMIASIKAEAKGGMANVSSLYQIKQFLNEGSKSAYNKGGQIFSRAGEAARAAKEAAGDAREMLKPVASEISIADAQLSRLHAIESRLNKNLLAAGKPEAALLAAGSGANARNAANLRALEDISGVPVTQRAKDLATAKTFSNPSITPSDFTGKAVARMAAGAGLGYLADGEKGAYIGGAVASPMALKLGINAANMGKQMANKLPSAAQFVRQNPVTATALTQMASRQLRHENPQLEKETPDPAPVIGDAPKAYDRWAQRGLERLGIEDEEIAARLLQNKQARRLLIEASDLTPGSKAMQRIMDQLDTLSKGQDNDSLPGTSPKISRRKREPARGR